jgi:hypothetical protein
MYRDGATRTLYGIPGNGLQAVSTVTEIARAEALFVSDLQPSDEPTPAQVTLAIRTALLRRGGGRGCAAVMAAEFGERPEASAARMRWALGLARPVAVAA